MGNQINLYNPKIVIQRKLRSQNYVAADVAADVADDSETSVMTAAKPRVDVTKR